MRIDTTQMSAEEAAAFILRQLEERGMLMGYRVPEDTTPTA